jgi:hypothetical protein
MSKQPGMNPEATLWDVVFCELDRRRAPLESEEGGFNCFDFEVGTAVPRVVCRPFSFMRWLYRV